MLNSYFKFGAIPSDSFLQLFSMGWGGLRTIGRIINTFRHPH